MMERRRMDDEMTALNPFWTARAAYSPVEAIDRVKAHIAELRAEDGVRPMPSATELARFNAMRAKLLGGKPLEPGERMPVPHSGVGGDVPGNG